MTALATFPVLMQTGIHSARPAASAVGTGALYSCTTHNLIYQTDGSSWTTWATVSGGLVDPMTTRGDMIVRNASNVTARLPIGSTGKVLSSDGTDISWQTPGASGSGLTLLEQHAASSSATLDFTTFISSTYDEYLIEVVNLIPATSTDDLYLRMGTGGGPTWDAGTNYGWAAWDFRAGASTQTGNEGGTNQIKLTAFGQDTTTGFSTSGSYRLFDPQGSLFKQILGDTIYHKAGERHRADMMGTYESSTAVTGVRFLFSSGNIASGKIRIYGLAK